MPKTIMMGDSKLKNTKSLLDHLNLDSTITCFICKRIPENPHILWCKHSFCKDCVVSLEFCPCCDLVIKPSDIVPDVTLNKLICVIQAASDMVSLRHNNSTFELVEKEVSLPKDKNVKCNKTITFQPTEARAVKDVSFKSKINTSKKRIQNDTQLLLRSKEDKSVNKSESIYKTAASNQLQSSNNHSKCKHLQDNPLPEPIKDGLLLSMKRLKTKSNSPTTYNFISEKTGQAVTKVNAKGETTLQIACRQGKLTKVKQLLQNGAEPNVKDFANWTPLCDAVGSGNIEIVRALLTAGAGVNTPSHLNTTALLEAVLRQDKAMVELLLSYGADMHQRTSLDNTALSIADDEIKALMMCSNVRTHPHPRVKTIPKAVLVKNLPQDQTEIVVNFCKKFNLNLTTAFTENISHMVVEKTEDNFCCDSTEVMLAILHGCCVVGMDWVSASLERDQLLSPDDFEPNGTVEHPYTHVFQRARLNKEQLLPRLFDGCHIAFQNEQPWPTSHKQDLVALVRASGAQYLPRTCDAERIPSEEQTVMFHAPPTSPFAITSHIVLYQPGPAEPLMKYNMTHIKTLPLSWFLKCVNTFTISM